MEKMPSISIEEKETEETEEPGTSRPGLWSEENGKSLYQLADTGLWWDSFEEETNFQLSDDFMTELTLSEGEERSLSPSDDLPPRFRLRNTGETGAGILFLSRDVFLLHDICTTSTIPEFNVSPPVDGPLPLTM